MQWPELSPDPAWTIRAEGFDPLREREYESMLAVGNGRCGTRGSLEDLSPESSPAVLVAGVFGKDPSGMPGLLSGPEWTRLFPSVDGEPFDLTTGELVEHYRVLDLRRALLFRRWIQRLPGGNLVRFESVRLASLADRRLLVMAARGEAQGEVRLTNGVPLPPAGGPVESMDVRSHAGNLVVEMATSAGASACFAIDTDSREGAVVRLVGIGRSFPADNLPATGGEPASGGGEAATSATTEASRAVADAGEKGFGRIVEDHINAWNRRWESSGPEVDGDEYSQKALRFAVYHLISAADPETDSTSVGPKGLTGAGYRGHIFWDTDVFVVPFFIWTHPPTARALLGYRHRTLDAARAKAAGMGFKGALYAWESADSGEDVTPAWGRLPNGKAVPILTGQQEHHISADVAWACWRYWQASGDREFLLTAGAEIIIETARFWASRCQLGPDGRFHITGIIGPDEYHENVSDNAFTNVMARWNLTRASQLPGALGFQQWRTLAKHLRITDAELDQWERVALRLADGLDQGTGIYEQFEGFRNLEPVRATDIASRPFSADVLLGPGRVDGAQVIKQADVLMLPMMLPEELPQEVVRANFDFYEPRCSHGSSLSPAVHAIVAARLRRPAPAMAYFRMNAAVDLEDTAANVSLGMHMASLGGSWQAAVLGFGGLTLYDDFLRLDPYPPQEWKALRFPVVYRGAHIEIEVRARSLTLETDGPIRISLGKGKPEQLKPGKYRVTRSNAGWPPAGLLEKHE